MNKFEYDRLGYVTSLIDTYLKNICKNGERLRMLEDASDQIKYLRNRYARLKGVEDVKK